jgi:hypothetical protein
VEEKKVFYRPSFASLANRGKVLVHLVALQGWPFVTQEAVATDAAPAELEEALGIPGGTLRPILKELKDHHFIRSVGRRYSVRQSGLDPVQSEIETAANRGSITGTKTRRRKRAAQASERETVTQVETKKRSSRRNTPGVSRREKIDAWIEQGFFEEPRSLSDVKKRFHEEADIVKLSSLPSYLLDAVKRYQLKRTKMKHNGKEVWVYQTS